MKKLILILLLASFVSGFFDSRNTAQVKVVIPKTSFTSSVTNYVLLIDLSSSKFKALVTAARSDGMDIRAFRSGRATSALDTLSREAIAFAKSPQVGQFYCLLDSGSSVINDTLYLEAGSGVSFANDANTWLTAGYLSVCHFEDASGNWNSSTGRNTGAQSSTAGYQQSGAIGKSISVATSTYAQFGSIPEMSGATNFTIDFWVNVASYPGSTPMTFTIYNTGTAANTTVGLPTDYGLWATLNNFTNSDRYTGPIYPPAAWHHMTWTYNGAAANDALRFSMYLDGIWQHIGLASNPIATSLPAGTYTYWYSDNAVGITGNLDEMRLNTRTYSPAEAVAYHNNENSPATFYTVPQLQCDSISPINWSNTGSDTLKFYGSGFGISQGAKSTIEFYTHPVKTIYLWSDTLIKASIGYFNGNDGIWVSDTAKTWKVYISNSDSTQIDSTKSINLIAPQHRDYWTGHSFIVGIIDSADIQKYWYYPTYSQAAWCKEGFSGQQTNYISWYTSYYLKNFYYFRPTGTFFLYAGINDLVNGGSTWPWLIRQVGRMCDIYSTANHYGISGSKFNLIDIAPYATHGTAIQQWDSIYSNLAASHGWLFTKTYDTLVQAGTDAFSSIFAYTDGLHPNAAGARAIAKRASVAAVPSLSTVTRADPAHCSAPCSYWLDKSSYTATQYLNKITGGSNFTPGTTVPDTGALGIHFDGSHYLLGPMSQFVQGNREFTAYVKFACTAITGTDTCLLKNSMLFGWRQQGFGFRGAVNSAGWCVQDTQASSIKFDTMGINLTDTFFMRIIGTGTTLTVTNLKTGRTVTTARDASLFSDTSNYQYYVGYGQQGAHAFTGYLKSIAVFPTILNASDQNAMDIYYGASSNNGFPIGYGFGFAFAFGLGGYLFSRRKK